MILRTKLHIPHSRREILVERPAIIEMLNEGLKTKLTIVTAPAGYGKTTGLSEWARQCGCPVVWISLDRYDNDLVQFWSYVIAAVERVSPNFVEGVTMHLASLKSEAYEPFIAALLNGLNSISDELVLIFDDFHVIELSTIHDSITYMLEYLPPHIHLYIASRFFLPFPMARLQAKGQMYKITTQDLRFQLEEGIHYFRHCMRLWLSDDDAAFLIRHTEGWISGLHLAARSLKSREDPSGFIRDFSGEHRDITRYLLEELFHLQSEEINEFLMQTSIVSRMNGSLCEAITGLTGCQEQLEGLERQNLFIIPLDERGEWYRYHHLFAEFLQQQFQRKYPERWDETHANAARWFENHGLLEEAVSHFLIGHHHLAAASLIEKHMGEFRLKRRVLYRWLSMLPESVLMTKPGIQCLYIKISAEAGDVALAETRLRVVQDKLSDPDWKPWTGAFLLMASEIALYRKDIQRTTEYLEMFEQYAPEGSHLQMVGGNTLQGINYDTLLDFINDLHVAADFFLKWIELWEKKEEYPFVGYFYVSYGELLYEWNRLEEAELYLERALRQKQMQAYAQILVHASMSTARIRQGKGDVEGAMELLEQMKLKIHSPDKRYFVMKLEAEKMYLSLIQGSSDDVGAWLQSCGLKSTDSVPLNRIREYLHLARALMEYREGNEALHLLNQLYRLVNQEDRLRDKIKVLILQSRVLHRLGDTPNALMKLEVALHLAEPQEYIRSFVDEGSELGNLLAQYLHHRQQSFIRKSLPVSLLYVKKLLHLMNVQVNGMLAHSPLLTEQETKILRMVQQGLTNKQIAERINVTGETVKMHMKNIYRKLNVNSRLQATQRGKELNLL